MFPWPLHGLPAGLIDGAVQVIADLLNVRETAATKRNDALKQPNSISYGSTERCHRLIQ